MGCASLQICIDNFARRFRIVHSPSLKFLPMNTRQHCARKAAQFPLNLFTALTQAFGGSIARRAFLFGSVWVGIVLDTQPLAAATTSWTGATSTAWTIGTNWSGGIPTSNDVAVFNSSFSNQPAYSGDTFVSGLWLATGLGQDVSITAPLGALTLTGTSTLNGNANTAILLDDSANRSLSIISSNPVVTLANDTSFLVNNAGTLTILKTNLNGKTLTLGGTNAGGNIVFTGTIGTTNPAGSLIVNTAGTVTLSAANTFTGGMTIKGGTVKVTSDNSAMGAGSVTLGDSAGGSAAVNLLVGSTGRTFSNAIILAPTTTGLLTIGNTADIAATTFTGGVTGSNNLTINNDSATAGARTITFSTNQLNHAGTITNIGTSTGTTTISGGIGSNVTGITLNSTTSALTLSTSALSVNSGGTTLTNASGTKLLSLTGGTTGTGNLILKNDSSTAAGITVSTSTVNHSGTVINSGAGTGTTLVSAVIGSAVTGVIQDSATSALVLSGANTFSGGLEIRKGTVQAGNATALGTGVVTLGSIGNSTTLDLNGQTLTVGGLATAGTAGSQILTNTSATAATVNYTGATSSTFGGIIQNGTGTTALTLNNGFANLTLSGANTYTGATIINAGTLKAANLQAFGTSALTLGTGALELATDTSVNAYNLTVNAPGATLIANRATAGAGITHTLGTLAIGAQQLNVRAGDNVTSGTAGVTFGATTLSASGVTFDTAANTNLTLGALGGNMHLFKQGAGTLTLAGTSTRAGSNAYLNAGNLVLANPAGLGTTAAVLYLGNGTTLDLATDTTTNAHPVTLLGNSTILSNKATAASAGITQTLGTLTVLGANTLTIGTGGNVSGGTPAVAFGAATMNADTTFLVNSGSQLTLNSTLANGGFTSTFTGAGNSTVTGVISGGGALTKNGAGNLTLSAANTYTGGTQISAGTVTIGNATALGAAATAVVNLTGTGALNLNALSSSLLKLSGTSGTTIQNSGATNSTLTVNPVANSTSNFAGTLQNGGGAGTLGVTVNGNGALTLSGTNTSTGATTLTAGRLNLNSNGALGTAPLTLTTGIIDNTSGSPVVLTNNNNITLGGNFTFGGSNDLSFGSGTLSPGASRTVTLMGTGKLTLGTWAGTKNGTTTFINTPGATSTVSIGTLDLQTATSGAGAALINGNANLAITGGIISTIPLATATFNNTGTTTLTGTSTYTGATAVNAGNFILDASSGTASLNSGNALSLGGGTFTFKGNNAGTGQTLGAFTAATGGGSTLKVVAGTSGTTLALGAITNTANGSALNISLDSTNGSAGVTTSTAVTNNLLGARGSITVSTGGTTEFATKSGSNIVQYTGQTAFVNTGSSSTVNYKLTGSDVLAATESMNSLRLAPTAAGSLDLNGKILTLTSGGLLYTGANAYEIKDVLGGGSLKSSTATNSDLLIHNYGTGGLTISAVIANGTGNSIVTLDGTGTTTLSGVNTYTGTTVVGGGAILSVGANSALGAVATGGQITINNGTLQATNTFALDNAGSNNRIIALNAGGGTLDVTGSNTLTVSGVINGTIGSLTKAGTGTLLLTGANTYSGGFTHIQNGTLQIGGASGAIASGNTVTLGSGSNSGKLVLGDASNTKTQVVAGLTTQGSGTANAIVGGNASNSTLTYTGTVAVPYTFNGSLGGAGTNENNLALTVTAGQLTLGGTNTYTGGTTLSGGVLNLNSTTALGSGALAITNASAVIDNTSGSAKTLANNNNVTTTTGFVFGGSHDLNFGSATLSSTLASTPIAVNGSSTLTFGGGLVNNLATGLAMTLTVNGSAGTLSLGGYNLQNAFNGGAITNVITGSGNVNITGPITNGSFGNANGLTYSGTGVLTLSGANTYTGLTTMNNAGGILKFGSGGSLNGGAGALTLTAGSVDVGGQTVTVGNFNGTAGLVTSSAANGSFMATLTNLTSANHFAGNLSVNLSSAATGNSAASGNFSNTGDLTFNHANTNTGTLTISGASVAPLGNLTFNANGTGSIAASAASLNNTGTITNSGSGSGTTTISGTVGSNVTAISNTNTSPLTISGAVYVNPAGLTVTQSGTGLLTWGASTINGTGNVTVVDSSTTGGNLTLSALSGFTGNLTLQSTATTGTPGAITVSGGVNNLGLVTNSGTGNAVTTISGIIGGNVTGVVQDSTTSSLLLTGANTFGSGTTIKAGTLTANGAGTELGTGIVTLGNTTGTAAATLSTLSNGRTYANAIVLATNPNVGALTIQNAGVTTSLVTYTGGVTGNNNLIIASNAGTSGTMTFSTNLINNAGTVTHTGTSTGGTTITGGIGSNVTEIIQNSAATALTISTTALTVNSVATTLSNNSTSGSTLLTLSGGTNGTGNLILNNNSSIANGITVGTLALNHTGTVTNSGTGTGATNIGAGLIGANITGVIQDSATSDLILAGAQPGFSTGLTVKKGTVQIGNALSAGTGTIILGDSAGGSNNASVLGTASQTFGNAVVLAANTTGTLTLGTIVGGHTVTYTGGVTGTNDLTLNNQGTTTMTFSTAAINNAGTVTIASSGSGGTTLSGGIGSNVTEVIQNSATSTLTLNTTALTVNSGGTTLTNNGGRLFTMSSGVTGTGDLILENNSTLANGITLSTSAVNHTGTITNSGTGTGNTLISGGLGTNVTGVIQDSATSGLTLSGASTSAGGVFIKSGTVTAVTTATALGSGTVLLGDATGSANATLLNSALTIANNVTVQAGNSGRSTLGAATNANATYSGNITLNKDVTLTPYNGTLTFTPGSGASFTGSQGIQVASDGLGVSSSGQSYGIGSANVVLTAANTFNGDTRVLSGALTLSRASAGSLDAWLGTTSNAIMVGDTSGGQSARLSITGTGATSLSRNLVVQAGSGGIAGIVGSGGSLSNLTTFSGGISLEKSAYLGGYSTFSGAITKAVGAVGATGITSSNNGIFVSGGIIGQVTTVNNSGNTYDGGTTVGAGILAAAGSGVLGTGNVVVESGTLRIASAANVASGKSILVGPLGQLTVSSTTVTPTDIQNLVAASSSGGIGLATGTTYNTALNLSLIGNGNMALGTEYNSSGTYSASSLGANLDGNYRLGWGGANSPANSLTISNGVLVGASAQLQVGGSQGFIGFNGPSGGSGSGFRTDGNVTLNAANTYGGGTVVNSNSRLIGQAQTSGSPFGSTTAGMTLHNSTLQLKNSGTTPTSTTVGAFGFDGASALQVDGITSGSNTLNLGAITRNDKGVLMVNSSGTGAVLGSTVKVTTTSTLATTNVDIDSSGTTAAMVAPYFYDSNSNAMTYDVVNGFSPITTSLTTLASGFAVASGNAYVRIGATETINGSGTIGALSFVTGNSVNTSISSSVVGEVTLTIKTGFLNAAYSSNNGGPTIGSASNRINLDFNGNEALIGTRSGQNGGMKINGVIGNTGGNGLTKFGGGSLDLANFANTFTGTVTINEGAISITSDVALGDANNDLRLNGGALYASHTSGNLTLNANRDVILGPVGGTLMLASTGSTTTTTNYGNLVVDGKITGTGGFLNLMTSTNYSTALASNSFTFTNVANDFVAPIYVGANQSGRLNLVFTDDRQLGDAGNTVTLVGGNSQLYYNGLSSTTTNRGILFADQGGGIEVANAVTLTAGGTISGSGMFNKNGIGQLNLTGANTYTATTLINAGVLNVSHADALGATTAAISGNSGVSGGGVYVQSGAALEVQGNIALGNAGGKTTYLNGNGISNGGALRNVSGNNSNAGAVILQSNTTIGSDSGTLTLSGVVSGSGYSMTKVGAGTLAFTGANTYTGATNVNVGTLIVNGSLSSSSLVTVAAGAKLGGSGSIGDLLVEAGGTHAPGNSPGLQAVTGNASYASGSTFAWELNQNLAMTTLQVGPTYAFDQVAAGSLSITSGALFTITLNGAGSTVDFGSGFWASNQQWLVFGVSGAGTGDFTLGAISEDSLGQNYTGYGSFDVQNVGGDIYLNWTTTAIPEPSSVSFLLVGSGLGLLIFRRRRLRR